MTAQPPTDARPRPVSSVSRRALVSARRVAKAYGDVPVLQRVDFTITEGVTGLLGSNGAGKTTLLGMILGLHPIDSGRLLVYGRDPWTDGAEVRAMTGYAPEHHTLPAELRADDFVRHVAELHGLPRTEATTRASDALWLVGLGEERFRALGTMSTGQRQRVKLAQAIAHDPRLVLLDEPTDGLDPVQRDSMLELIRSISTEYGIHVVLSSHLLDEVEQICDGVVIIGEGRTLAAGSMEELRGDGEAGVALEIDGTNDDITAVATDLHHQGWMVTVHGRRILVAGEDESVFDATRDACVHHGVGIHRLSRRRLSLEDVFLERLG